MTYMAGKGKRNLVSISSSSSSEEEDYDSDYDDDDEEEDGEEESIESSSDDAGEWSDDEEADRESFEDDHLDDESRCNRVIALLKGGSDLQALKLEECKAYLRKHGLRLTGSKAVCIKRIQEHWRIKDGNGETLYPRSSFAINCRGDVCTGDVVLFMQRVYEKFNKVTRNGNLIGKRTIAGRVVKESYGAAKQQHTFTVEILWSKGPKRLPPLSPLLVKGRNLYRLKTFRQRWNNETERSKVLAEKHKRGTAARHIRAMKESRSTNGGAECQRHSYHTRPPRKRRRHSETGHSTKPETMKCVNGRGKAPLQGQEKMKRVAKPRGPKSSPRHLRPTNPDKDGAPIHQSYTRNGPAHNHYRTQMQLHSRDIPLESHANSGPFQFEVGSTSAAIRAQPLRPYMNATAVPTLPTLRYQGYNHAHHAYSDSSYQFDRRNLNRFPNQVSIDKQLHPIPLGAEAYRPRNKGFLCSTPWCQDLGDESCVVSSCWRCCRKTGRGCLLHQFHSPF